MTVGLSPTRLPRSRSLTEVLTAPPASQVPVTVGRGLAVQLAADLGDATGALTPPARLRVDEFLLATATPPASPVGGRPFTAAPDEPFRWSARNARRSLGIAAVRACHHGLHRAPADAVAGVLERLAGGGAGGQGRGGSLGRWLAGLPAGARAAVQADAVTWATRLYIALDWRSLPAGTVVGGRDQWWDCPPEGRVGLRGRAEVRTWAAPAPGDRTGTGPARERRPALFCLRPGLPGPTSRIELALPALVSVLAAPADPAPARVVGWWPTCGRAIVLEVDQEVLGRAAEAVVAAVRNRLDVR